MNRTAFETELAENRLAYDQFRHKIKQAAPGHYAVIARGSLISVTATFEEAAAAVAQLQPSPEHFLVFPVDQEPAFEVIDDFSQTH